VKFTAGEREHLSCCDFCQYIIVAFVTGIVDNPPLKTPRQAAA
jgi:hypothetical protein